MIVQFIYNWQARATRIQPEQSHWVMPLVRHAPLEQEYRHDRFWQANQNQQATDNLVGSKRWFAKGEQTGQKTVVPDPALVLGRFPIN